MGSNRLRFMHRLGSFRVLSAPSVPPGLQAAAAHAGEIVVPPDARTWRTLDAPPRVECEPVGLGQLCIAGHRHDFTASLNRCASSRVVSLSVHMP